MPFGLKNAGATYQRCMQKCLHDQIRRNAHAYVDDTVIKTKEKHTLLADLKETFDNLRRFQMKLNPEKCVFGIPAATWLPGVGTRNRGQPGENSRHRQHATAKECQGHPEIRRLPGVPESVHQPAW